MKNLPKTPGELLHKGSGWLMVVLPSDAKYQSLQFFVENYDSGRTGITYYRAKVPQQFRLGNKTVTYAEVSSYEGSAQVYEGDTKENSWRPIEKLPFLI